VFIFTETCLSSCTFWVILAKPFAIRYFLTLKDNHFAFKVIIVPLFLNVKGERLNFSRYYYHKIANLLGKRGMIAYSGLWLNRFEIVLLKLITLATIGANIEVVANGVSISERSYIQLVI